MNVLGLHHTGLAVLDINRASNFYSRAFGFTVSEGDEGEGIEPIPFSRDGGARKSEMRFLSGPTGCLQLHRSRQGHSRQPHVHETGIRHVCLQGQEAGDVFDRAMAAGASGHARPAGLGTGVLYAYIRDPMLNLLEIEGLAWTPAPSPHAWFAHTALVTPDMDRLTKFYESLTGVHVHDRRRFGPHPAFDKVAGLQGIIFEGAWIRLPNATLEFWQYEEPASEPGHARRFSEPGWSHLCLEVSDIGNAKALMESAGALDIQTQICSWLGTSVYGRDPDGNIIELIEVAADRPDLTVEALAGRPFLDDLDAATAAHYRSGS